MLRNYIKIAFRNLIKNRVDSVISIGGLAVGLACCILLVFYVRFEWSYDNFHENADRVYRLTSQSTSPNSGEVTKSFAAPYPLGAAMDSSFPEINKLFKVAGGEIHIEEDGTFHSQRVLFSEPGFFQVFTFPLLSGNSEAPLSNREGVVLTKDAAERLFRDPQAVGETLTVRLNREVYSYHVSAVAENPPANSSIQFEIILPFENYFRNQDPSRRETARESWWIGYGELWLTLHENSSPEDLEAKFPALIKTHFGNMAERTNKEFGLQPLENAYFDQEYSSVLTGSTNFIYIAVLGGIALAILAIAGMNYMSLTLTRAYRRSHEMGIRKAAGAQSRHINAQIFGEVLFTCGIAFVLGVMLAEIASPLFQEMTGRAFQVQILSDPVLWMILLGMLLLLTVVTGSYPAWRISRKKASHLFSSRGSAERIPRFVKGLICVQFALAIAFLIATFTVNKQMNYLLNKDLGFSASGVVTVELNFEGEKGWRSAELFSREARQLPGVRQVSVAGGAYRSDPLYIQHGVGIGMGAMMSGTTLEGFDNGITSEYVDEHYLETLDMELLEGRNFSPDRPDELENGIIINESFAETMGWEAPVGQVIEEEAEGWTPPFDGKEVIGVVGDFHFKPLYDELRPIALQHLESWDYGPPGTVLVKAAPGALGSTVEALSSLWNKILPEEAFNYNFLDDMLDRQYQEEQRWETIIRFASFMAIGLACFGLFGLAVLSAQRRTREIGIRKVLGATVANIVTLLSADFVKLVGIGFLLALPVAYYAMNRWLADFAYRIELGVGLFLLAGSAAFLIAVLTVSWQSLRAALANPVDSLRNE